VRYQFIEESKLEWPVRVLCSTLKVSHSGFYEWRGRPTSARAQEDEALSVAIKAIHQESRETYGSPRIHVQLKRQGVHCGKNRVTRLMATAGIAAKTKRKFKATTDSKHRYPVAENVLNRQFTVKGPNEVWLVDITYIWTREGWLYLAAVLDLYSRRIVGWALERRMTKEFACRALEMALNRRRPGRGLIHHSDRGSQYASGAYQDLLANRGIIPSMSRKGDCWDNAPMESFFHTLKVELVHHRDYRTREEARGDIIEYMEMFYNWQRRHSSLDYATPMEYERVPLAKTA